MRTWGPRQCTHQRSGRFCTARRDSRGAAEEEEEAVWESTFETLGEATCDLWAEARVALEGFAATGAALDARPDLAREPTERAEAPAREPAVGALAPPARVPEAPMVVVLGGGKMTSPPVALQSREEGREAALGGRGITRFPSEVPENARKGRRVASDGRLGATAGEGSRNLWI